MSGTNADGKENGMLNPLEHNELQKAMILRGVDYETSELIIHDFRVRCVELFGAERYHKIMQAEREGRMVILPCKRGDPVWRLVWEQVTWPDESRRKIIASNFRLDDIYEIGKTVFLTREEAEKVLEDNDIG